MCVSQLKQRVYIYIYKLVPPNVQDMVTALINTKNKQNTKEEIIFAVNSKDNIKHADLIFG